MAALDTDLSDVWWLRPAPARDQSANVQAGAQLRQQREQFEALLPIRKAQAEAQLNQTALELENAQYQHKATFLNAKGMVEVNRILAEHTGVGNWIQAEREVRAVAGKYPLLSLTPSFQAALNQITAGQKADRDVLEFEEKHKLDQEKLALAKQKASAGMVPLRDEEGNIIQWVPGPIGSATASTKTRLASQIDTGELLTSEITDLLSDIRPEDVGVRGKVASFAFDRVLPQLGFDTADPRRIDTRQRISWAGELLMKAMRQAGEGTFSDKDRAAAGKIVATGQWGASYPEVVENLNMFKRNLPLATYISSKNAGQKPPEWVWPHIGATKVRDAWESKLLSEEEASNIIRRFYFHTAE